MAEKLTRYYPANALIDSETRAVFLQDALETRDFGYIFRVKKKS